VPDDANMVIINVPSYDFTEGEVSMLRDFIKNGGNVVFISSYEANNLPILNDFAAEFGLKAVNGLVCEGSSGYYNHYPYHLMPKINSNDISAKLPTTNVYVYTPLAHGIVQLEELPENVTVTPLFTTTDSAYAKLEIAEGDTIEKADGDISGPFMIGAYSTLKSENEDSGESTTGGFIWFSSQYMVSDEIPTTSYANASYFMALSTMLCDKEDSVSIASVSLKIDALTVSESTRTIWSIVLLGIVPIAVLAYGFFVWIRRKKN